MIDGFVDNLYRPDGIDFPPEIPTWPDFQPHPKPNYNYYYITNYKESKEEEMSLVRKYMQKELDKDEQIAYEAGAIDKDGILTEEGLKLFCQVMLDDELVYKKFLRKVKKLAEDEE